MTVAGIRRIIVFRSRENHGGFERKEKLWDREANSGHIIRTMSRVPFGSSDLETLRKRSAWRVW